MNLEEITLEKIKERLKESWDCSVPNNEVEWLIAEVERLQQWVNDLQSRMFINCVYCGHRYGPDPGTPVAMADILRQHIEICPKHPLSRMKSRAEKAEGRIRELEEGLKPFAEAAKEADKSKISEEAIIWKPQNSFRKISGINVGDLCKAYCLLEEKER